MKPAQYANTRVLIVDDQREIHDDLTEMLRPMSAQPAADDDLSSAFVDETETPVLPQFQLLYATTGEEAYDIIANGKEWNRPIAVAYMDIRMPPGIDGVETIRRVRTIDRDVEIVIMTAYADRPLSEIVQDMELLHKLLYIRKPFAHEEIQQITLSLVGKWNVERELAENQRRPRQRSPPAAGGAGRHRRRHGDARRERTPGVRQPALPGAARPDGGRSCRASSRTRSRRASASGSGNPT